MEYMDRMNNSSPIYRCFANVASCAKAQCWILADALVDIHAGRD